MEGDVLAPENLVPEQYRGLTNPLLGNQDEIDAGRENYFVVCASCHGEGGRGDGAAAALDPAPPDFTDRSRISSLSDGYLYWRIAEGGSAPPFKSSMPAWGSVFNEDQIWQLVAFLRTFPE
jgi:mono/diheme cytochrome c family protein